MSPFLMSVNISFISSSTTHQDGRGGYFSKKKNADFLIQSLHTPPFFPNKELKGPSFPKPLRNSFRSGIYFGTQIKTFEATS